MFRRGNKKTSPVAMTEDERLVVPPLFAPPSREEPQGVTQNGPQRDNGRTRRALLLRGGRFRQLLREVASPTVLSPSHRTGALCAGAGRLLLPFITVAIYFGHHSRAACFCQDGALIFSTGSRHRCPDRRIRCTDFPFTGHLCMRRVDQIAQRKNMVISREKFSIRS